MTAAGNNTFHRRELFTQSALPLPGAPSPACTPTAIPVAQVPGMDAALGVCHYLDATLPRLSAAIRSGIWSKSALACVSTRRSPARLRSRHTWTDVAQRPVDNQRRRDWGGGDDSACRRNRINPLVRTGGTLPTGAG